MTGIHQASFDELSVLSAYDHPIEDSFSVETKPTNCVKQVTALLLPKRSANYVITYSIIHASSRITTTVSCEVLDIATFLNVTAALKLRDQRSGISSTRDEVESGTMKFPPR